MNDYEQAVENGFVGTNEEYQELINGSDDVILADFSSFFIANMPLPTDHWLFVDQSIDEIPEPILDKQYKPAIVNAVRHALRACTNNGKDMDLDPDALVQNVCIYLTGYEVISKEK